ncbi:glycosyltransferase family 4 protein [Halalkaliarchaeum sp. AArc-GB]|uniref:glycosyltransferase family 4 protein n=1 Tax=Halalkaliarchaeum sp. AArc-GB TaxID=3074078 RepID=UPI00285CAF1B|nr:glycosyltransferase family 4 protein [Halalkaliarchaeum sp. AArc-GB]MDR5674211.1 glycosyltransferase family 4 protein [Halalkaliarchaeum sp. AArc-GB]
MFSYTLAIEQNKETMSAQPRIFHLITRLIDGGAVNALVPIATEVDGFDVTVGYGAEFDQHLVNELQQKGVDTKQFPLIKHYNPLTAIGAVFTVARYIQKHEFDIIHTHSTEAGIIGRTAAQLAGAPNVVHTIHGVPFTEDRNDILNWFVKQCERVAAPWTDEMISIADVISEEYLSNNIGRAEQYRTIKYGIELNEFHDASPTDDLPGSGVRILMVSRLVEGKGFDVLLDAVERLDANDLSVLIAGDGPLRDYLMTEIRSRGLDQTVFLLGYREDIPEVMSGCDLLVLPSFREGTPLVIIEAMATGLPVLATNIAGIPEIVDQEETGILIEPGDVDRLADELERFVRSPRLRKQFGRAGRQRTEHFLTDRMVSDYSEVYHGLISNGG